MPITKEDVDRIGMAIILASLLALGESEPHAFARAGDLWARVKDDQPPYDEKM
jgi:hypothetical protein